MLLVIKITRTQLANYRKEFLQCLKHNSENVYINQIYVFTDDIDHKILMKKTSILFKRKIPTNDDLITEIKKISKYNKIMISDPFIQFQNDLYKVTDEDLKINILKNQNYLIFSKNSKFYNGEFETKQTYINLSINKIKTNIQNEIEVVENKSVLIKKSIYDPNKVSPTIRNKKLDVLIVSVNYNDYLLVSLVNNIKVFENITVVTTNEDIKCQEICKNLGVNCVISERVYDDGAKFNKGKAINDGIKSLHNPDLILLLDSDIVVKEKIDLESLSDDVLYTSNRIIYKDYNSFISECNEIEEIDKGWGFFQLFCFNNPVLNKEYPFPESSETADGSDLVFRDYFEKRRSINKKVIHLGDTKQNWKGRVTEKFITDEQLKTLINETKFEINKYFDNIYCLNLDKRQDRWEKVSEQFKDFGIIVEKWSAIEGDNINDEKFYEFNTNNIRGEEASNKGLVENKNSIACLLSHLEIIKNAKSNGYKKILIFEDDIFLSDNFNNEIKSIEEIDWRLLYLGSSQFDWSNIKPENKLYKCSKTLGTFAYALDISIYDEVLKMCESSKKSIDNILSDIQSSNNKCYTLFPNIVISDVSESDIRVSKSMTEYSKRVKWNLDMFSSASYLERIKSTTIIIPCYGHSKYLEECIDSCLSQSLRPGEILVLLMDEDSISMKSKIENKSNIIKCIVSEKMKLSEARNFCVDKIKNEYFIPLDADDKIPENFIEEICKIESDVVYIGSEYFGSKSGVWPDPITEEIDWTKLTTFRRNSLVCTALIKKESFIKSGKYKESLWAFEDMDLWIRMYKNDFIFKKCFNTKLLYRKHFLSDSLLTKANSNEENKKELKRIIMDDDFYKRTPKIIHWVWIGNNPIPENILETWKENLPEGEWTYMMWNEKNFDMNSSDFLKKSYELKKYGICVDYIRAKVLYEYGGVWLDADCIIKNDISSFLQYDFFASWENEKYLNIGLIGCKPKLEQIGNILNFYSNLDVEYEVLNSQTLFVNKVGTGPIVLTSEILKICDIINGGFTKEFTYNENKFLIETPDVFVLDDSTSGRINYAIHLFDGSWTEKKEKWSDVVNNYYKNWKIKNKI